jgi:predicted RNA-binding protein YlqC (UPF0109 family)
MLQLIEDIAKAIVDHPAQVRVHGVQGESFLVIGLSVAKDDLGKIIGKQGRTIAAMWSILHATRAQQDTRHVLEILE